MKQRKLPPRNIERKKSGELLRIRRAQCLSCAKTRLPWTKAQFLRVYEIPPTIRGFVVMCTRDRELHSPRVANCYVGRAEVTQVIPGKAWKAVLDDYKPHFPDSRFTEYALKGRAAGGEGGGV
jgi:hypothetical protein